MNRVAIIGSGGAGKSTFARELGARSRRAMREFLDAVAPASATTKAAA